MLKQEKKLLEKKNLKKKKKIPGSGPKTNISLRLPKHPYWLDIILEQTLVYCTIWCRKPVSGLIYGCTLHFCFLKKMGYQMGTAYKHFLFVENESEITLLFADEFCSWQLLLAIYKNIL